MFKLNKGHLISKNPSLPNLTIADLYSAKIDTLTKKIDKNLHLNDIIFPVFHFKKVAFLCLTPQILNIDWKLKPYRRQALTFDKQPQIMTLNGTIVWDNLRWSFSGLKPEYAHNNLFLKTFRLNMPLIKFVSTSNK